MNTTGKQARDIYDKIMDAAAEYYCKTGIKPRSIYLGQEELEALTDLIRPGTDAEYITDIHLGGISLYRVQARNHLACA